MSTSNPNVPALFEPVDQHLEAFFGDTISSLCRVLVGVAEVVGSVIFFDTLTISSRKSRSSARNYDRERLNIQLLPLFCFRSTEITNIKHLSLCL